VESPIGAVPVSQDLEAANIAKQAAETQLVNWQNYIFVLM
jgi:hypothetical protein